MKKPLYLTLVVATALAVSPLSGAPPGTDWKTIEIFAAKFTSPTPRVAILKGDAFHDTGVIWSDSAANPDTLEWVLECSGCGANTQFAIYDVRFVGDLDALTLEATTGAPADPNAALPPGLQMRRGKSRVPGLRQFFDKSGGGVTGAKKGTPGGGGSVKSRNVPAGALGRASELWKYSVMVEEDASNPDTTGCLRTVGNAILADEACCEESDLCDFWDPHIYMHGDMSF